MNLFGFESIPKGIKVTIYDPAEKTESGMLIFLNERFWRKSIEEKAIHNQGKRKKKYMAVLPIEEDYHICELLKKSGYKILLDSLGFEEKKNGFEVFGKSNFNEKIFMDSLENYFNLSSVLDFYKNNEPEEL